MKNLFSERGLFYEEDENSYEDLIYTEEIKRQLDEHEEAYQRGELIPISSPESKRRITELLNKLRAQNAV